MNSTQTHNTFRAALTNLTEGKIKSALDEAGILISELQSGEFTDRFNEIQNNYKLILQFYVNGADDPQRKIIYNKLIAKLFVLVADLREELLYRNSSNFEYTQKRYFPYQRKFDTTDELFDSIKYYYTQKNLSADLTYTDQSALNNLRNNYENNLHELFSIFWLTTRFNQSDKNVFQQIINSDYEGISEKALIVSALMFNVWRTFDEQKLMMLFDCVENVSQQITQRALVGLCFVLAKHNRFLSYFPTVRNRLVLLADNQHYQENFQNIIIQIIATLETDKISKKLREEILPEIMKISPALKDKMEAEKLLKSDEWEEGNPEWQQLLEESGVYDKIKELTELQMEGADVYMSTFSMLKNFTFFNEISNWFLPFDSEFLAVNELFSGSENSIITAFSENSVMCNSDKFSFCLSMMQMPEAQRNMIKNSFKAESEQLREISNEENLLKPDIAAKNISKQYIQDLYRFFRLHPQKNDFSDMFVTSLLMHKTFLFDILTTNSNLKASIAEYYFLKGHYKEAIEVFEEIVKENDEPSAAIFQKTGFCYQKKSMLDKALEAYLKADMIQPDDLWTVKKIALCYKLSGNYEKALSYYQHCDYIQPGVINIEINIAKCLMQLKRYADAFKILYRLDAENEYNQKIMRHLCWCNFASGNFEKAAYYSQQILNFEPQVQDFLNAGHIYLCDKKPANAMEFYLQALKLANNNLTEFLAYFNEDKSFILSNGIELYEINLVLDQILLVSEKKE